MVYSSERGFSRRTLCAGTLLRFVDSMSSGSGFAMDVVVALAAMAWRVYASRAEATAEADHKSH